MAALNNVELITALISCNLQLGLVGLQLRILNGVVSLLTTEVHSKTLAAYLSEQSGASGNLQLTTIDSMNAQLIADPADYFIWASPCLVAYP
jgi:hypothetical protein